MGQGLDKEFIRQNYIRLSDEELIRIISQDATGLTAEAVGVIKEELAARRLSPKLINIVEAQNKEYSEEELNVICNCIVPLPCPECSENTSPLTAAYICQTTSFIYITFYKRRLDVRCPKCVKSDNNYAFILSLLLGWWGLPYGPIRTIQSIRNYFKTRTILSNEGVSGPMRDFALTNIGLLELYKNDKEKISIILQNHLQNQPITSGIDVVKTVTSSTH